MPRIAPTTVPTSAGVLRSLDECVAEAPVEGVGVTPNVRLPLGLASIEFVIEGLGVTPNILLGLASILDELVLVESIGLDARVNVAEELALVVMGLVKVIDIELLLVELDVEEGAEVAVMIAVGPKMVAASARSTSTPCCETAAQVSPVVF